MWVSSARRVAKSVCQEKEKKTEKNKGNQRLPALPSSRGFICLTQDSGGKKTAAECQNPSLRKSHLLSEDGWASERSCACLSSVSSLPGDAGRGGGGGRGKGVYGKLHTTGMEKTGTRRKKRE